MENLTPAERVEVGRGLRAYAARLKQQDKAPVAMRGLVRLAQEIEQAETRFDSTGGPVAVQVNIGANPGDELGERISGLIADGKSSDQATLSHGDCRMVALALRGVSGMMRRTGRGEDEQSARLTDLVERFECGAAWRPAAPTEDDPERAEKSADLEARIAKLRQQSMEAVA